MKNVLIIIACIAVIACGEINDNDKNNNQSAEDKVSVQEETLDNNLNESQQVNNKPITGSIEAWLEDPEDDDMASFDKGVLSLCCYDLLDVGDDIILDILDMKIEEYDLEGQTKQVSVYYLDESFLKYYYNDHPNVMKNHIISGRITNNDLIPDSKVKIGMARDLFLERLFEKSDFFARVDQVDIYEDEIGLIYTSYKFENGRLTEIQFDSDYDWIDKTYSE